ncbi:MAG: adenosine kinase [Alphaproteobacteria bacterium]|nr:adenosine kinase [Alphaproteobacteria bacterium]
MSSHPPLGVVAVGNALVDVLAQTSEEFIAEQHAAHGMEKGAMTLIDEARAVDLYGQMPAGVESSGPSAANTMAGFASFGGHGAFIGKVADDELGRIFQHDLRSLGLKFDTQPLIMGAKTGRCLILVTPDAQRTMNTFLGASVELSPLDIDEALITQARVTYLEGYLFDRDQAKQAFIMAAEAAHAAGHRVALTLSDPFCVDRHRSDFLQLVENHVDILFATEEEIKSLFMQDNFEDAASAVSSHVEIAALTRSEKGAVIVNGEQKHHIIPPAPVTQVIDTTGAGDQFAAGFLYGFTEGMDIETCGKLGTLAAAEVISHMGPRPGCSYADLLKKAA